MLEREGFGAVTMLGLARASGLNRNTVYYHFRNVQEVAQSAFRSAFPDEVGRLLISLLLAGEDVTPRAFTDDALQAALGRLHLLVDSGEPLLTDMLKGALKRAWFSRLGISAERLTPEEAMQIEYIVSGFVGLLGNRDMLRSGRTMKAFPHTRMGRAAMDTLREIAARQGAGENGNAPL